MRILDSNFVIDFLEGRPQATAAMVRFRSDGQTIATTVITAQEILLGYSLRSSARDRTVALDFLRSLDVLNYESHDVDHVVSAAAKMRGKGERLGPLDEIIAGICLSRDAALVTRDKAFRSVKGLIVESW
ncbi:type II toxin-antitoxin system VapC family toxin [archaeon]|nr:type II toxin-antitoxin system VapC family toxin [archaeon]